MLNFKVFIFYFSVLLAIGNLNAKNIPEYETQTGGPPPKNPSKNPFWKCGENELSVFCSCTKIQPTCRNRNPEPVKGVCQCFPFCLCKEGYVREEVSKDCILPENCP